MAEGHASAGLDEVDGPRMRVEPHDLGLADDPDALPRSFPEFAPTDARGEAFVAAPGQVVVEVVGVEELGVDSKDVLAQLATGSAVGDDLLVRSTDDPRCWVALRVLQRIKEFRRWDGSTGEGAHVTLYGGVISPLADDPDALFAYVAGDATLPRAVAAVFAAIAALDGASGWAAGTAGTVEEVLHLAPAGLGRAFLSPRSDDRLEAAFNRPTWYLVHEVLARDRCVNVRTQIASLRGELLGDSEATLVADPDAGVRTALGQELGYRQQATVDALLVDQDPAVALSILSGWNRVPEGLDLSAAARSPHPEVRRAAACRRDHLDDEALQALRGDADPAVAAAATVAVRCRSTVSTADDLSHLTMWSPDLPSGERLEAALSTVGARNNARGVGYGAEIDHAWCVVAAVADVVGQCDPDDQSTVSRAVEVVRAEFDASIWQAAGHNVNEFTTEVEWQHWVDDVLLPAGRHLGQALSTWHALGNLVPGVDGAGD
ncbi:MAG: hypothetical protein ACOYOQ_16675 [Microthrixaceae bacterium]